MEGDLLTITEAAKALQVSKDTIRRRIKRGDLPAQKRPGPYGIAYYVEPADLYQAAEVVDVVPVARDMTRQDVQRIIEDGVKDAVKGAVQPYFDQQDKLIKEQSRRIEIQAERTKNLGAQVELMRLELEKQWYRPSWWERIFRRNKT